MKNVFIVQFWRDPDAVELNVYSTRELAEQRIEQLKSDPKTRGSRHSPHGFDIVELEVLDKL